MSEKSRGETTSTLNQAEKNKANLVPDVDTASHHSKEAKESGFQERMDEDEYLPYPGFLPVSFCWLEQTSKPRSWCLRLITWPWFEHLSMFVILLNCITLGMYQPCSDEKCETDRCKILAGFDDFIFAFFALEMAIKMIAMGVIGKHAYMGDTWNRLDFFIVIAGCVEYIVNMENINLSAIRTIRVLRPLRAINRVPSMRILVMLLLDTLPMLGNVLLLCFFVFFIFGIVGVQLWAGLLRNRCYIELPENVTRPHHISLFYDPQQTGLDYICSLSKDGGMHTCNHFPPFRDDSRICNASALPSSNNSVTNVSCVEWNQYYTQCMAGDRNPFQGAISFDNIGLAWVAIFLVISLEGWTDIMYYVQDAHSFWDWIYFVLLIVVGSFFMINLCLVVIATQFSETKKRETERMLQERARYQSTSTLASNSEPGGCYNEILRYIAHLWRRAHRKLTKYYKRVQGRRQHRITPDRAISLRRKCTKKSQQITQSVHIHRCHSHHHYHLPQLHYNNNGSPTAPRASPEVSDIDPLSSPRRPIHLSVPNNNSLDPSADSLQIITCHTDGFTNILDTTPCRTPQLSSPNHLTPTVARASSFNGGRTMPITCPELLAIAGAKNAALAATPAAEYNVNNLHHHLEKCVKQDVLMPSPAAEYNVNYLVHHLAKCEKRLSAPQLSCSIYADYDLHLSHSECEWTDSEQGSDLDDWAEEPRLPVIEVHFLKRCRNKIQTFVDSKFFQRGILVAILINTLSMGIEHHNQPDQLTLVLEYSNFVFTALFALEMFLKIIAEGPFGYISNGFNLFDGVIVILSIIELVQDSGSGLSVLRTFRLLRILKLVRFMPALRRQLVVMLKTMDNVATFFALLILFIFIFSILGMNLFGCKFCRNLDGSPFCERKNFDSLLWAIVTVFQILTQEDWNVVLFNGMEKTSHWAALYFVALMTFGNYVLFNLLVAILVEGFSAEDEKKKSKESLPSSSEKDNNNEINNLKELNDLKKDNLEKESKLFCLPPIVAVTKSEKQDIKSPDVPCPPIITHTAATPQGSPNATLEPIARDLSNKLSPVMAFNMSSLSIDSIDKSLSSQISVHGSPHIQKSISGWNQESLYPQKGSHYSSHLQRKGSKESNCSWKNRHKRRDDKENLVDNETPSEGEVDEDELTQRKQNEASTTLNNSQAVNSSTDHSHCVGVAPSLEMTPNNKRHILIKQNSIGSPCTLSPQNSLHEKQSFSHYNSLNSHSSVSRRNSVNSQSSLTRQNSVKSQYALNVDRTPISRQNSICSHCTLSPQNSVQSQQSQPSRNNSICSSPRELKPNNLSLELTNLASVIDTLVREEKTSFFSFKFEPPSFIIDREDYSLYIFSAENSFRKLCVNLTNQKWFDYSILFFIALNCITLAMERPDIPPRSIERQFLNISNYIFTAIFATEMTVKVIAKGLFFGVRAYWKSGWNIMDGLLVTMSLVDIMLTFVADGSPRIFGMLRVFRLLRSLRPLRVIDRAPGLKLVVQTLLSSLRPIGNIVLICCTFFIIFGILGVQLFKGTFYFCSGPNVKHIKNKTQCEAVDGHIWINRKYNFDNLGQALMALFVLSSKDGWVNIMYTGLDAVGVDQQPMVNHNEWRLLYFISFLLLVGFFVLNMFVGVVVENFHRCREEQEKEEKARRAAKRARKLEKKRKKMREPPYYINFSKPRLLIHNVVTSKYFDLAIAAVIGLNVITMAMEFYKMPMELTYALKIFNYFFTAVFILEAVMKMCALGPQRYFTDGWNQLDVVVVVLSVVGIILEEMESDFIPINPTIIRVMRVLRIARVLKLLKMAKGIRALLDTVIVALPQVGNLGLLFFLLFFIFAALGVELFGRLECSNKHPCDGLGEHAHFKDFGMAFLTLFRVATGDNWNGIMKDTLREQCDPTENCLKNCCVSPIIAPIYFVVFVLMAQFVLVNVVVAVLMKHLEESNKMMRDDIDMDAEIERELEEEARQEEVQRQLEIAKQQEQSDLEALAAAVAVMAASNDDDSITHKLICKQSSLPASFTFSLHTSTNLYSDNQVSPSGIEIEITKESDISQKKRNEGLEMRREEWFDKHVITTISSKLHHTVHSWPELEKHSDEHLQKLKTFQSLHLSGCTLEKIECKSLISKVLQYHQMEINHLKNGTLSQLLDAPSSDTENGDQTVAPNRFLPEHSINPEIAPKWNVKTGNNQIEIKNIDKSSKAVDCDYINKDILLQKNKLPDTMDIRNENSDISSSWFLYNNSSPAQSIQLSESEITPRNDIMQTTAPDLENNRELFVAYDSSRNMTRPQLGQTNKSEESHKENFV